MSRTHGMGRAARRRELGRGIAEELGVREPPGMPSPSERRVYPPGSRPCPPPYPQGSCRARWAWGRRRR
eukprot:8188820-Alexandrium_andersonii.AAC.1